MTNDKHKKRIQEYNAKYLLTPVFDGSNDVIWYRREYGFFTNVEQKVLHHSLTGFEIGFGGSGPADLALNILATLFPVENVRHTNEVETVFYGCVSKAAWDWHQPFKGEFLAQADEDKGRISIIHINAFVQMMQEEAERLANFSDDFANQISAQLSKVDKLEVTWRVEKSDENK